MYFLSYYLTCVFLFHLEFLEHAECLSKPELDGKQRQCVEGLQAGGPGPDMCR